MSLVGFQVARLRRSPQGGFELAEPTPFADRYDDARQALALAEGYSHAAVAVEGLGARSTGSYLAAFPASADSDPLLELDERGNPLPASDEAIEAIARANRLIGTPEPLGEKVRRELQDIHHLLGPGDEALGELLFERLHLWALENGQVEELPELFWLLPWGSFKAHLSRLIALVGSARSANEPPSEEPDGALPELSHSFRFLGPGLAPTLREITEWRESGTPISSKSMRDFTRRLRLLSIDKVPAEARGSIAEAAERLGRTCQHRLVELGGSVEHSQAAQVMIDVYEMLLDWKVDFEGDVQAGEIKWMGRVAFVVHAVFQPAGRLKLKQGTIDRLSEMADRFHRDGIAFEALAETDERWWDRILDAGFILDAGASFALRLDGEPRRATELANSARLAFERFGKKVLPYRARRWANALPEVYLLEARSAIDCGDYAGAGAALRAMLEAMSRVDDYLSTHTVQLHRAEVLLCLSDVVENDEATRLWVDRNPEIDGADLEREALRICEKVIAENFKNGKAWRIFISLVTPEQSVRKIEAVLEQERKASHDLPAKETLTWLEYQLAVKARQRADEMPELMLEAFASYLRLLESQPHNTVAVEELFAMHSNLRESQTEGAYGLLGETLVSFDQSSIPATHAALRWAIRDEAPDLEADGGPVRPAHAIPVLAQGSAPAATLKRAEKGLEELVSTRSGARLLEVVSKWLYDQARSSGDRKGLRAVGRLLDPAIAANPNDAIWWARRADVAIAQHDTAKAYALMEGIAASLREDGIALFQKARLLMLMGEFDKADKELIEAAFLHRNVTGEAQVHPAILDRRGFIALLEGRYPEAEGMYREILAENRADPAARYGLGRVYLQSPSHASIEAMRQWRVALRLRTTDPTLFSRDFAWQTAIGIAALISRQVSRGPRDSETAAVHDELEEMLAVEDAMTRRYMLNALRVRGVSDSGTAAVVLGSNSRSAAQASAQYLMARVIHLYIEDPGSWPAFVEHELPGYLEWCRERGVLGDFLAGSKGSYARAQIRASLAERGQGPDETTIPAEVSAKKLRKLVDHVVDTTHSTTYYDDAYGFLRSAGRAKDDQLVAVVDQIVSRLAQESKAEMGVSADSAQGRPGPIAALARSIGPSIGLETVGHALEIDEEADRVGAYVDLDALLYARSAQKIESWELTNVQLIGSSSLKELPYDRRSYARAGIRWEASEENGGVHCAIDLTGGDLESLEGDASSAAFSLA